MNKSLVEITQIILDVADKTEATFEKVLETAKQLEIFKV